MEYVVVGWCLSRADSMYQHSLTSLRSRYCPLLCPPTYNYAQNSQTVGHQQTNYIVANSILCVCLLCYFSGIYLFDTVVFFGERMVARLSLRASFNSLNFAFDFLSSSSSMQFCIYITLAVALSIYFCIYLLPFCVSQYTQSDALSSSSFNTSNSPCNFSHSSDIVLFCLTSLLFILSNFTALMVLIAICFDSSFEINFFY